MCPRTTSTAARLPRDPGGLRRDHGFTLVEILVAVAVLGILAAISVPVYRGHLDRARDNAALAEITSLKAAVAVYSSDTNRWGQTATEATLYELHYSGLFSSWEFPSDMGTVDPDFGRHGRLPSLRQESGENGPIPNLYMSRRGSDGVYLIEALSQRSGSTCLGTSVSSPFCTTDESERQAFLSQWS